MLPGKEDRKQIADVARQWFSKKEGLRKEDLKTLYAVLWAHLDETRKDRTQAWKHLVLSGERFTKPEFTYFRALAVEAFELFETSGPVENAVALRRSDLTRSEQKHPRPRPQRL